MARENEFAYSGNIADGESQVVIASGDSGHYRIKALHMDTSSSGPVMALVIGSTTAIKTVAPSYTVDTSGMIIQAQACTITSTGGTGDGNFHITVKRL